MQVKIKSTRQVIINLYQSSEQHMKLLFGILYVGHEGKLKYN